MPLTAVCEDGTESTLSEEVSATPVLIDITAPQTPMPWSTMGHS